jgi:uncharacterized protein YecT (DUF1311 family)
MIGLLFAAAAAAYQPAPPATGDQLSACQLGGRVAIVQDALFAAAARDPEASESALADLKRASRAELTEAKVLRYEPNSGRIECSGRLVVTVPVEAKHAFDGKTQISSPLVFTSEPSSDGQGFTMLISPMTVLRNQIAAASHELAAVRLTPVQGAHAAVQPATDEPPAPLVDIRPAFDCALASDRVEQLLCSNSQLADRDRRLSARYFSLRKSLPRVTRAKLLTAQRQFLRQRDACPTAECMIALYDERLRRLDRRPQ